MLEYLRINDINDPMFQQMHELMQHVFPPEEVLEFDLWTEPHEDQEIRVFVDVMDGDVVGATEYRYYEDFNVAFNVAMTDFTIIGESKLSIGPFLAQKRLEDQLQQQHRLV